MNIVSNSSSSSEKKLTVLTCWFSSSYSSSYGGCDSWFIRSSEDSGASCVPMARALKIEKFYSKVIPSLGLGGGGFWGG